MARVGYKRRRGRSRSGKEQGYDPDDRASSAEEARRLLQGYPANEREVHTVRQLGVRGQDAQGTLVVPRT